MVRISAKCIKSHVVVQATDEQHREGRVPHAALLITDGIAGMFSIMCTLKDMIFGMWIQTFISESLSF